MAPAIHLVCFRLPCPIWTPISGGLNETFVLRPLSYYLRYRAKNIMVAAMIPGPTEPTADQLQNILDIVTDDLLMLCTEGKRYKVSSENGEQGMQIVNAMCVIITHLNFVREACSSSATGHYM